MTQLYARANDEAAIRAGVRFGAFLTGEKSEIDTVNREAVA